MNKVLTLIITLLFFISCNSKSQSKYDTKLENFKTAYIKNDEKLFLANFPKSYNQFVNYFGWNDKLDTASPLYNESEQYIDKFFNIISKDKSKESLKLVIDISLNGKYQADAVNYFKINIEKIFTENPELVCELLKNRKPEELDSFWHFYLDSPQPLTTVPNIFKILKKNCFQVYLSLENELQIIQKENLVSEITSENKTNKLKLLTDFVPKDYMILESLSTDLNNDNLIDKIIILANNQEFRNNESRLFMILINNGNNEYSLKLKSPNIIPCIKCAGGTGVEDSYADLNFKKQILSFTQLKIIDAKIIKINYEFLNNKSDFKLIKITVTKSNLTDDNTTKVIITTNNKISIKDFDYENYIQYINYSAKISDIDGYTNLRKEKSSTSEILQKINTGSLIEVLDNSNDWWLIQTKDGKKGYVYKTKIKSE